MPIEFPTIDEVVSRSKTDVESQIPGINPFDKNNVVTAMTIANANRVFDFYIQLQAALLESLPDTAIEFLDRWAAIFGIIRLPATGASGNVIAVETAANGTGTSIVNGTIFSASDGQTYTSNATISITESSIATLDLTRQSNVTLVTTDGDHGFSNNTIMVSVTGTTTASDDFNVLNDIDTTGNNSLPIIVLSADTFSYPNTGVNESATGQGTVTFRQAIVPVDADTEGADGNQDFGTSMSFQTPLAGADNTVVVDFGGIAGGTDQETNESLRTRLLERIQNPVAHFNPADIEARIKQVNGITRVFVFPLEDPDTGTDPTLGTVTVYFMRDNDTPAIPTAPEVADAQAKLDEIRPANTAAVDAVVKAPTGLAVPVTISSLVPDTPTMQTAITANLAAYFSDQTQVAVDIQLEAIIGTIFNTVDPDTGDIVVSFTLDAPAVDVVVGTGIIGTLGTVTIS